MSKNFWIKFFLLCFIFLMVVFPLNNYYLRKSLFFPTQRVQLSVCTQQQQETRKKPAAQITLKPEDHIQKKSLIIEKIPATEPINQIQALLPDLDSIQNEMNQLALHNIGEIEIRRFYIPPVEYNIDPKKLILPTALIATGYLASQSKKYKDFIPVSRPNGKVEQYRYDDYLQYSIPPCLFVFDAIGKEKHNPIDQVFIMGISYGLTALQVRNLKPYLHEERPDGGMSSFPSGHTAVACVGAHMIYKEFIDTNPWIAYSGYVMAGAVGFGRLINNRHWFCDVIAGAGIAILSTELAYMIYFPIRNLITDKANDLFGKYIIIAPIINPSNRQAGIQMNVTF